jgi:hypothetical protein
MKQIDSTTFPILKYVEEGLDGQEIGFPTPEFASSFTKEQEFYVGTFMAVSFRYQMDGRRITYISDKLNQTIDSVLYKDLWKHRNNIDSLCGIILQENGNGYLYSLANSTKEKFVMWHIFSFYPDNNYLIQYCHGCFFDF